MKTHLAVLTGKLIGFLARSLKLGGGSAAPGLSALKIDPKLIVKLSSQIPQNIIITGTNGKTTTAKMLAHFAQASGLKVIRNHTGSNLERGIASALISNSHIESGKLKKVDLGIWELDEAAFVQIAPSLNPKIIVFLNAFRDQLDRYGEVDSVIKKWSNTLKQINKHTIILINGDDQNLYQLQEGFSGKIESFGITGTKIKGEQNSIKRTAPLDYETKDIQPDGFKGIYFQLLKHDFYLHLPGIYQVYNATAALICAEKLNLPLNKLNKTLDNFSPAFGRVEKIKLAAKKEAFIFLIKNPIGATQVFQTIAPNLQTNDRLLLALNDNFADGTDVSWIWDVNFEIFQNSSRAKSRDIKMYVAGTRAEDLAVRLKYAGLDVRNISVEPTIETAFANAQENLKGRLFILPTYTAMLELQNILVKQGIKEYYWKENN